MSLRLSGGVEGRGGCACRGCCGGVLLCSCEDDACDDGMEVSSGFDDATLSTGNGSEQIDVGSLEGRFVWREYS